MTYRVGNHQPQNVYRDDAYIGVMFTAEDAALVVEALSVHQAVASLEGHGYHVVLTPHEMSPDELDEFREAIRQTPEFVADSCTGCTPTVGHVNCPVHHGRKPRGPKPPPLGEGCICDGQDRFQVSAIFTFGPDLAVQCTRCHRWTTYINRPLTLAQLIERVAEHAAVCP